MHRAATANGFCEALPTPKRFFPTLGLNQDAVFAQTWAGKNHATQKRANGEALSSCRNKTEPDLRSCSACAHPQAFMQTPCKTAHSPPKTTRITPSEIACIWGGGSFLWLPFVGVFCREAKRKYIYIYTYTLYIYMCIYIYLCVVVVVSFFLFYLCFFFGGGGVKRHTHPCETVNTPRFR